MPDSLSGTTGSDPASEETSANPVRYFDGAALVATTDLSSTGCGAPFGQSRTWTNQTAAAANLDHLQASRNGNGWVVGQLPWLAQDGTTVIVVAGATNAVYFDHSGSSYVPRFFVQDTLVHDEAASEFL